MVATRSEVLAAQGLDESDLATNRTGRVSQTQLARQIAVRSWGARGVWLIAGAGIVGCTAVGLWRAFDTGDRGFAVFMSLLGLVIAAIPLGVYYGTRFADPAKVGASTVTRLDHAKIGGFLPAPSRGIYAIGLDGKRYSGFANALTRAQLGTHVHAYVVAAHGIVVALEPTE